ILKSRPLRFQRGDFDSHPPIAPIDATATLAYDIPPRKGQFRQILPARVMPSARIRRKYNAHRNRILGSGVANSIGTWRVGSRIQEGLRPTRAGINPRQRSRLQDAHSSFDYGILRLAGLAGASGGVLPAPSRMGQGEKRRSIGDLLPREVRPVGHAFNSFP